MSDDTPSQADSLASRPTIAMVRGEMVTELPTDLYIPPDALEVFLETLRAR